MDLHRGEIFFAELSPVQGSEQGGNRPVLVVQNDIGNHHSPTTIILPITSKVNKSRLPTHVDLAANECGLSRDSIILAEQVRTIDKARLQQKVAELPPQAMERVDKALGISMGILS